MYIDFNDFFTIRTRNLRRIKEKLPRPPHLYSVIALPSKTHTTANINAHVWLIDVMVRQQHKSNCNALNKKILKRGCSVQYVLVFYEGFCDCKEHHLDWISCPESLKRYQLSLESSDGHCMASVQLTRNLSVFLIKWLILATDHLLFVSSFY